MKVWKLVSGILSIVLSGLVLLQSGAAGLANTLEENGEVGGTAGLFVAVLLLTVGIVSIAVRKSKGKGGNIAIIILSGIAAGIGFGGAGGYSDLKIWSGWCLILLVMALVAILIRKKPKKEEGEQ